MATVIVVALAALALIMAALWWWRQPPGCPLSWPLADDCFDSPANHAIALYAVATGGLGILAAKVFEAAVRRVRGGRGVSEPPNN